MLQRIAVMKNRLEEQESLCDELRGKLKKYRDMEEAANTVKTLSQTDLKSKYESTRHQLIQQMNKTKDTVSYFPAISDMSLPGISFFHYARCFCIFKTSHSDVNQRIMSIFFSMQS